MPPQAIHPSANYIWFPPFYCSQDKKHNFQPKLQHTSFQQAARFDILIQVHLTNSACTTVLVIIVMLGLAGTIKDKLCERRVMNTNVKVCVNISSRCRRGHSGLFWVLDVLTAGVQGPWRIIHLSILMCSSRRCHSSIIYS